MVIDNPKALRLKAALTLRRYIASSPQREARRPFCHLQSPDPETAVMPAPLTLPVISISPYLSSQQERYSDEDRAQVAHQLHRACRDIGFFYLKVDDYVTETERQRILDSGKAFFLQSTEDEKAAIGLEHGDGARGQYISLLRPDKGCRVIAKLKKDATGIQVIRNSNRTSPWARRTIMKDWICTRIHRMPKEKS